MLFRSVSQSRYVHLVVGYAGAIVVTVPEDPLHFSAPVSAYNIPPPLGFVDGLVTALAMNVTNSPVPNDPADECSDMFPLFPVPDFVPV